MTLKELGQQYLKEAERLSLEVDMLNQKRKGVPFYSKEYVDLTKELKQKQQMADEAEETAYKLIDYYRKR